MRKVMGGFFEIDVKLICKKQKQQLEKFFNLDTDQHQLINSGRGCLSYTIERIKFSEEKILIPDYLCSDVIIPILKKYDVKYEFFPVQKDFDSDSGVLMEKLSTKKFKAVLLINYFGLVDNQCVIKLIKQRFPEIIVIQDCVQDPFYFHQVSIFEQVADYAFASFRKSFPIIEGGCLRGKKITLKHQNIAGGYTKFFRQSFMAAFLKERFVASRKEGLKEDRYLRCFEKAKRLLDNKPRKMTLFSKGCLNRMNLKRMAEHRRRNYLYMISRLKEIDWMVPVHGKLPESRIPLFCPVYVHGAQRDRLRKHLTDYKIFCPIHWPLPEELRGCVGRDAQFITENLLSLVIDQRYKSDDLDRMIGAIKEFQGSLN